MARELLVGVKIGAALASTFRTAFAGARSTSVQLGQVADQLRVRHQRLGEVMARAMAHPTRNVGELRRQYERLGQTLEQLRLRQERLTASMARGEALRSARADLRGQAMETVGTTLALAVPVVQSVRLAAGFQDQMRDTAITGEFSVAEEARLGSTIRAAALQWNQTQAEIARGTGVLVAGGIQDAKALENYAPIMAKAATATRASMDDLGSVAIALNDNLKVGVAGFEGALNMLAYAGKRGQFEIRDMAKWLPALSPAFQALGITGKEAVAEIGAALQIARKGAGSNDEAANNFKNFLQKITSPDTLKDFAKAGIDLQASMMNLRAQGLTPMQSMLAIITDYMQSKGPAAAGKFQQAMAIKDDKEREAALQRLASAYKLGELFQDMQAMSFIRPAIANSGEMKSIKDGALEAENKNLLDSDFQKRMEGASEQFKAFKIGLMDIGLTIGDVLLPPLNDLMTEVRPGIKAFGEWAKAHPGLIKGVIGLAGGLLAGKLAFIGLRYGLNLLLSPFTAVRTAIHLVSARWMTLRGLWLAGRFAPLVSGLRAVGGGLLRAGRFLLLFGRGMAMAFGSPLVLAGRGVWFLSRLLGGQLISGLRLAGRTVLWLGRALLMNPLGLAITGIAIGAYLIYCYWSPIKRFFGGLWSEVKTAFAGGIGSVIKLIINWSPLGLFYRAFAGVMKWFGVSMPKTFTDFGANLISGLLKGLQNKIGAAKDAVMGFGKDIKSWFANSLGIQSPSRVFMGFGDNIAQGTALGIGRSSGLASKAAASMAAQTAAAAAAQRLQAAHAGAAGTHGSSKTGLAAGVAVHFNPVIHLPAGAPESIKSELSAALKLSLHELEQLIKRVVEQQARRAY
ncbi:phage tail tape measure protein [Neisseriaceae bacterium TC5R-5]|nr:phage tail tape measure protein [Neisseriaceae bacterium TC5R-5]